MHIIIAVKGFFLSEYTKTRSAGALPQTPLGEVTAFPPEILYGWFQQDGERITGREGRTTGGAVGKRRGKRGITPWLLGEIDAPDYMHVYCIVFFWLWRNFSCDSL